MLIHLDAGRQSLEEPHDFTRFAVVVTGDGVQLPDRWRLVDSDHAAIPPEDVVALAGDDARRDEWRAGFSAMIAFADERGWVAEDGAIRAHIERMHK